MKAFTVLQIVLIFVVISSTRSTEVTNKVVQLKFNDYSVKELEADLTALLNQSISQFFPVIFKRYPGILKVIKAVLNETSQTNYTLDIWQLCSYVESVFNQSGDACNVPTFLLGENMSKLCDDSDRNVSFLDEALASVCPKNVPTTPDTRPTTIPTTFSTTTHGISGLNFRFLDDNTTDDTMFGSMLPSNSFFLAIKALTGTVFEAHRRKCLEYGGTFSKETMLCTKNSSIIPMVSEQKGLQIISIVGNLFSFLSCVLLVACYVIFKRSETLPGKNTMCLSSSLALGHFIQFVLVFTAKEPWACRTGATFLHWALLLSFTWMAILAYEFYITFTKLRVADKNSKDRRFKLYACVAFTFATLAVFICLMIDIPDQRYAGYGVKGACFVTGFWANLFAFIVPVCVILLSNIILLAFTIYKLRAIKKSTEKSFTSSNSQTKRKKIVLSSLTIKLSILFGLGWILAFVDGVHYSIVLRYLYTIIISTQGLLVYICFGCHKESWDAVNKKIRRKREMLTLSSNIDTQQTSV